MCKQAKTTFRTTGLVRRSNGAGVSLKSRLINFYINVQHFPIS